MSSNVFSMVVITQNFYLAKYGIRSSIEFYYDVNVFSHHSRGKPILPSKAPWNNPSLPLPASGGPRHSLSCGYIISSFCLHFHMFFSVCLPFLSFIRAHSLDLRYKLNLHLQKSFFQIRSHSQVLGGHILEKATIQPTTPSNSIQSEYCGQNYFVFCVILLLDKFHLLLFVYNFRICFFIHFDLILIFSIYNNMVQKSKLLRRYTQKPHYRPIPVFPVNNHCITFKFYLSHYVVIQYLDVFSFLHLHQRKIVQCIHFFFALCYLHLIYPGKQSISVHSCGSFFLIAAQYSTMWMYHGLFHQCPVLGHQIVYISFSIINSIVVNNMVFMFYIFVEGKFLKWDHWLKIYVNVYVIVVDIGKLDSVLHSNWQYMRVPVCSQPQQQCFNVHHLLVGQNSKVCYLSVVLIPISQTKSEVKLFFFMFKSHFITLVSE